MRVRPVGSTALLLECETGEQVEAWRGELWRRREAGELTAVDIVPGAGTILLDGVPEGTAALLADWAPAPAADAAPPPTVQIPTVFDGEDLGSVAELWGVTEETVVERLVAASLTVAFCGFAPGFAYLRGLPSQWAVPRLDAPRPSVPAGSVALAGEYAGIYPTASPGGWRLVGRTDVNLFDVRRDPPALLTLGARVRLVPA
ncbi:MAG TPA: allophanate hydrolase subunit 1 [Actinoplanes sp.]|nr:allophanate hydrolase subunit 1 [Actinoplanes sp.]